MNKFDPWEGGKFDMILLAFLRASLKPLCFFAGRAGTYSSPEEKTQVPLWGSTVGKRKPLLLFVRAESTAIKYTERNGITSCNGTIWIMIKWFISQVFDVKLLRLFYELIMASEKRTNIFSMENGAALFHLAQPMGFYQEKTYFTCCLCFQLWHFQMLQKNL